MKKLKIINIKQSLEETMKEREFYYTPRFMPFLDYSPEACILLGYLLRCYLRKDYIVEVDGDEVIAQRNEDALEILNFKNRGIINRAYAQLAKSGVITKFSRKNGYYPMLHVKLHLDVILKLVK